MTAIDRLRLIGFIEAVSFIVLVGIAVPLKHLAGMPTPVHVAGRVHGALFIAFCVALATTRLSWRRSGIVLLAACLPFGPFVIDRRLRAWR